MSSTGSSIAQANDPRLEQLIADWAQGKVSLQQVVGLTHDELFAIASQGYYLFLQGKTEPARILFEGLIAINPRSSYYYRALGAIYWRLGDSGRATRQFTYAIRVAPREITSYVNRAEVYVAQQAFELARNDLNFVIGNAAAAEAPLLAKAQAILKMIP